MRVGWPLGVWTLADGWMGFWVWQEMKEYLCQVVKDMLWSDPTPKDGERRRHKWLSLCSTRGQPTYLLTKSLRNRHPEPLMH